jgi:hypothetical protein
MLSIEHQQYALWNFEVSPPDRLALPGYGKEYNFVEIVLEKDYSFGQTREELLWEKRNGY